MRAHPDPESNAGAEPGRPSAGGPPRWVKAFGAFALIGIALVAAVHLAGGDMGHLNHGGSVDAYAPLAAHGQHAP